VKRSAACWLVLALLTVPAVGDRIVLKDGRSFEGTVTESGGKILIEMPYGTISVPASDVESIVRAPSPAEVFLVRLAIIDRTDPNGLSELAEWARERGLVRQAEELLKEALAQDADHPATRRLLGYVKVDGKWLKAPEALKLAEGKLQAGKTDVLLKELLPALDEVIENVQQRIRLKTVEAHALLRTREFAPARRAFEQLAGKRTGASAARFAVIADILKKHPDGVYVLTAPYPAVAMLLGAPPATVQSGPASLSRPAVLKAALRGRAIAAIKAGRAMMEEGKKLELTEPEAAKAKYDQAGKVLDQADSLVPNIARSYRIEIVRRRIALITKGMNTSAGQYDALKEQLAKRDLTPAAYASLIIRMVRALNNVRGDLDAILALAAPYGRELVLEITDAKFRRQRVDALRNVLMDELKELDGNR